MDPSALRPGDTGVLESGVHHRPGCFHRTEWTQAMWARFKLPDATTPFLFLEFSPPDFPTKPPVTSPVTSIVVPTPNPQPLGPPPLPPPLATTSHSPPLSLPNPILLLEISVGTPFVVIDLNQAITLPSPTSAKLRCSPSPSSEVIGGAIFAAKVMDRRELASHNKEWGARTKKEIMGSCWYGYCNFFSLFSPNLNGYHIVMSGLKLRLDLVSTWYHNNQ
ncbi:hypothetical protein L6452_34017 [Arctium lappa]|uniref:Uncharacterized protein n=1 Tax=Arctium lappa TaxID=4217 RepID=A0ACB8YI71_ARCLA|nr:hypothetical protein L6452_34017 [Arctium lappa]